MLLTVILLKGLTELALMFLLGRFILGWLAGSGRQTNGFWLLLDLVAKPVLWVTRRVSPRLILDRHIPLAAAGWLGAAWLLLVLMKIDLCHQIGVAACR